MGNTIIKGQQEKVYFNAPGYYGIDVNVSVFNDDTNTYIVQDVPMTEVVVPVDDFDTTTVNDQAIGDTNIELDSVDGLAVLDRLDIGGDIYRVNAIDTSNNTITLHRPLLADIASGSDVTRVGNMGIYRVSLFITISGSFIITGNNKRFGIQLVNTVTVKESSLEDLFSYTNTNIDENERIIKETSSFTIII